MITSVTATSLVLIHPGVWKRVEIISAIASRAPLPVSIAAKLGLQVCLEMGYLSSKS